MVQNKKYLSFKNVVKVVDRPRIILFAMMLVECWIIVLPYVLLRDGLHFKFGGPLGRIFNRLTKSKPS